MADVETVATSSHERFASTVNAADRPSTLRARSLALSLK